MDTLIPLPSPRIRHSLNSSWEFVLGDIGSTTAAPMEASQGISSSPLLEQTVVDWRLVNLPHTWNVADFDTDDIVRRQDSRANGVFAGYGTEGIRHDYYRGVGWYRRALPLTTADAGRKLYLYFDGANQEATVFVNGCEVGRHHGGYTAFCFDITPFVGGGQVNWTYVKVSNAHNEEVVPVGGDLGHFGGIYRTVYLLKTSPVHFDCLHYASPGVYVDTPCLSEKSATVRVRVRVRNETAQDRQLGIFSRLVDPAGKAVMEFGGYHRVPAGECMDVETVSPSVAQPLLWSPDHPHLYHVEHRIEDGAGQVWDAVRTPLGFRVFAADMETGFLLNGERLPIRGIGRHQDSAGCGYATPYEVLVEDTRQLKRMGANFMRGHYSLPDMVYNACDELGILCWEKIVIMDRMNFTAPFIQNARDQLREIILQQYNHPSIAMWGYACEILGHADWFWPKPQDPVRLQRHFDETRRFAEMMESEIRTLDQSRLTCNDNHTDPNYQWYGMAGLLHVNDLNGWNLYQGWYHGSIESIGEWLELTRSLAPDRPYLVAEFGAGTDLRIHTYEPSLYDMTSEHAERMHRTYLDEVAKRPWVAGMFIWTLADFQRTSIGDTMRHINNKGMLTNARRAKDTFYLYKSHWNPEPMVRIAGHDWPHRVAIGRDGIANLPIHVHSNQQEVELFLNGTSLGLQSVDARSATWTVPFPDGPSEVCAVTGNGSLVDRLAMDVWVVPPRLADWVKPGRRLGCNVGNERCHLNDPVRGDRWLPDQPFRSGGFGYLDGRCYRHWPTMKAWHGIRDGVRDHINGTDMVPIFQTFRLGVTRYRLDVADGEYEVTLCFTEPFSDASRHDGTNPTGADAKGRRVFSVDLNGMRIAEALDLAGTYGPRIAVRETVSVSVSDGHGIRVDLLPIHGEPILCGVAVKRLP